MSFIEIVFLVPFILFSIVTLKGIAVIVIARLTLAKSMRDTGYRAKNFEEACALEAKAIEQANQRFRLF